MKIQKSLIFLFALILCSSLVLAIPATWRGYVQIDGVNASKGTVVAGYVNGVLKQQNVTGQVPTQPGNYYSLNLEGASGDTVTFVIYNISVNESAQTWSSAGIITDLNLTTNKSGDNAVCVYSQGCSGGYCCSGASQYDGNGVGTCQSSACSAPATPTGDTGGGGGGGGGGGTAGESQTKYTGLIQSGTTKEVKYSKEDTLKITSIEITTTQQVTNAGVKVAVSSSEKAGIAIAAGDGGVYKYLEITKSLISDDQIASAKIYFKVEKSWYTDNNYAISSTIMKRKVGDAWQDLTTTKYKEDASYYYFYADSSGLSYFAIVAYKTTYAPPVEKKAECGDGVCEYDETCSSCAVDCSCKSGEECVNSICKKKEVKLPFLPETSKINKTVWIWIAVGLLILAIVIIYLVIPKKKK